MNPYYYGLHSRTVLFSTLMPCDSSLLALKRGYNFDPFCNLYCHHCFKVKSNSRDWQKSPDRGLIARALERSGSTERRQELSLWQPPHEKCPDRRTPD
ncbi:hypothetical protein CEXT_442841 [Caerostris extrusa]|uniref:Uncharacterized protein n=1 Tax=Caerostris extrusa TaxID=172846 RepID=A0AAV4PDA2_CAEEX|nr:hypothetical protein CEXT_442841 [Caerostris extrusa]